MTSGSGSSGGTGGSGGRSSGFELLHPALQHHIVNSVGWRSLRPLQDAAVGPIVAGNHVMLLAPTAGGKTEAAMFPLLSRALSEEWRNLSVLYLCPLRALLNNLQPRLDRYATMVGRRAELWHGDTGDSARRRLLKEPPDVLLTTPESLEAMLISTRVDQDRMFASLRAVVIDEAHAFAAADRGWHLLAVLARLEKIAGRPLQRVALSATVGNPEEILAWICGGTGGTQSVMAPASGGAAAEVTLDALDSVEQAVTVIDRLHRGEKRLAFTNARALAEKVASQLGALGSTAFVSHSSLGPSERRRSEEAFATARDCVIVSTSTLELGIDIGDLDRVIQIGAPSSVNSMLQRIGRTGRRPGTQSNMLVLPLDDSQLLQSLGVLHCWSKRRLDPVQAPPFPLNIVLQQTLALILQQQGITRTALTERLVASQLFDADARGCLGELVDHLVGSGVLVDDHGLLSLGRVAEDDLGRRNFLELTSVFVSPTLLSVRHGAHEVGAVEPRVLSLRPADANHGGPTLLSLAGRTWKVRDVDWRRLIVDVEPAEGHGIARWAGDQNPMSPWVARGIRSVLAGASIDGLTLSKRASAALNRLRASQPWVMDGHTAIVRTPSSTRWWTYAGPQTNDLLARGLTRFRIDSHRIDPLWIKLDSHVDASEFRSAVAAIDVEGLLGLLDPDPRSVTGVKFANWIPDELVVRMIRARNDFRADAAFTVAEPMDSYSYSSDPP